MNKTVVVNRLTGEALKNKLAEVSAKLPGNFKCACTKCGAEKAVRKDVFMDRVEEVGGDVVCLMKNYHCQKCRKAHNVDMIGNTKVSGGNAKVITLADLE